MSDNIKRCVEGLMVWCTDTQRAKPRPRFATTGYRKEKGIDDLFSIWVVVPNTSPTELEIDGVQIHALVSNMAERLPKPGEILVLTDGVSPIAQFTCHKMGN